MSGTFGAIVTLILSVAGLILLGVTVWEGIRTRSIRQPGFLTSLLIVAALMVGSIVGLLGGYGRF